MNIENLDYKDYFNLFCFINCINKRTYKYQDWQPREEDIEEYNKVLDKFKEKWNTNRAEIEKPIIFKNVKRDQVYIDRLKKAHEFEIFVEDSFKRLGIDIGLYKTKEGQYTGETEIGLEIKYDMQLTDTGNIYIEYQEKASPEEREYYNSGILKQDNTKYWLIGNKKEHYFIAKSELLKYYKNKTRDVRTETSKGFLIPRKEAKQICVTTEFEEFAWKCL